MRVVLVAALAASSIVWAANAEAQSRRGRAVDRAASSAAEPAPPRGFDRYAEPRGGGTVTWNTPYPNGNFSNPGGGGGGGSGP